MCLALSVNSVLGRRYLAQTRGIIKYRRQTDSFVSFSGLFRPTESYKGQRNSSQNFLLSLRQSNVKRASSFNQPIFDNVRVPSHSCSVICRYMMKRILFTKLELSKCNHVISPVWRSKRRKCCVCEGVRNPFPGATAETTYMK
jgi:hypothetical protein